MTCERKEAEREFEYEKRKQDNDYEGQTDQVEHEEQKMDGLDVFKAVINMVTVRPSFSLPCVFSLRSLTMKTAGRGDLGVY